MGKIISPLVSIIIRTKNEERWISKCLKRINEQTYKKFEIIIVDNGSTDKTNANILKSNLYNVVFCFVKFCSFRTAFS